MTMQRSTFTSPVDGLMLATYEWDVADPRGMVQVAHGLAEHSARYDRFARALNAAGYTVRACDHRGHGDSIADTPGDFGAPGFDALIADLAAYGASLHRDLPLFLFAHSMGSFAAQSVIRTHSDLYAGVVLSGSTAPATSGSHATRPRSTATWPTRCAASTCRTKRCPRSSVPRRRSQIRPPSPASGPTCRC
jgi:alpha-beta hydrolase superfamily lysophospholipase